MVTRGFVKPKSKWVDPRWWGILLAVRRGPCRICIVRACCSQPCEEYTKLALSVENKVRFVVKIIHPIIRLWQLAFMKTMSKLLDATFLAIATLTTAGLFVGLIVFFAWLSGGLR